MTTLPAIGHPADTVGNLEWVPGTHHGNKDKPGQLNTFGAAWLMASKVGAVRSHPRDFPCAGLGQLVHILSGPFVVGVYPSRSITERGAALANGYNFLNTLDQKYFDEWCSANLGYVSMPKGSTLWLPYGWHIITVANYFVHSEVNEIRDGYCAMLVQPYLAANLVNKDADAKESMKVVVELAEDTVNRVKKDSAWAERNPHHSAHADAYLEWLQVVNTVKTSSAIADAPDAEVKGVTKVKEAKEVKAD